MDDKENINLNASDRRPAGIQVEPVEYYLDVALDIIHCSVTPTQALGDAKRSEGSYRNQKVKMWSLCVCPKPFCGFFTD